ncbi:interleukin-20 receptor subunit alpha [Megalops cyprinoides]|uniref:interleukin-20 receptor subunit alpha n=1 Tax=Megalops cyprinoides TaxID=118141 RepID=UPI001864DC46|nr:interleukin-20 receptor subunit alpha [Megalops cyprinoides]
MNGLRNENFFARGTSLLTALIILKATVVTAVAPPQDVQFSSCNLRNVVEWRPGNRTGNGTQYTVQYAIYGDGEKDRERVVWRTMKQCMDVVQTSCDLSNETRNLDDQYYARVRVTGPNEVSKWATTAKFFPKLDTTFGPPIVKVTVKERSITIKLKGPMRWKTVNSKKEYSMAKYYRHMMYNVSVYNNRTKQTLLYHINNSSMELGVLDFSTEYCVSARALFTSLDYKTQESDRRCVTTEKDPFMVQILQVTLGCILPSAIILFVLLLSGCLVYHYIFGNKPKPPSNLVVPHLLDMQKFCTDVFLLNLNLSITVPTNQQPEEEKPLAPIANRVSAPQSYAPQGAPRGGDGMVGAVSGSDEGSADASGRNSPVWVDSSMPSDYGLVVSAQKPLAESEVTPEGSCCDDVALLQRAPLTQDDSTVWALCGPQSRQEDKAGPVSYNQQSQQGNSAAMASYKQQCQWDNSTVWTSYKQQSQQQDSTGLTSYRQQSQATQTSVDLSEMEDLELDGSIVVDWDPSTRKLQIPLLSVFQQEPEQQEERPECDQDETSDMLSRVFVRQSSAETSEQDALTKMENNWALRLNIDE